MPDRRLHSPWWTVPRQALQVDVEPRVAGEWFRSKRFVFYNKKTPKWLHTGKRRRKLAHRQRLVNFIHTDATIVNSFSRFSIGYLKKSVKRHWFKS